MRRVTFAAALPAVMAMYLPFCAASVRPTMQPWDAPLASFWKLPQDLQQRDLFNGPWGASHAPDPRDTYAVVDSAHHDDGEMTVRDTGGRIWTVRLQRDGTTDGRFEVVVSRLLSAVGYHQPPVYYLPSFTLVREGRTHVNRGGSFRLHDATLTDKGLWSWQQNPFVGMRPYQGLLVMLMMFGGTDLENTDNSLYEHRTGDYVEPWYVVRDLRATFPTTEPARGDGGYRAVPASRPFVVDVRDGFAGFDYRGSHRELVRRTLTADDVGWAGDILYGLSDRQWHDAVAAGGFPPGVREPLVRQLRARVAESLKIGGTDWRPMR